MLRLVTSLDGSFDDVIIGMIPALPRHVEQFARYLSAHCAIAVENLRTTESMHKGTCYLCSSRDTLLLRGHGDGTLKAEFAGRGGDFPPELVIDTVFRDLASIVAERAIGVVIANDDDDRFDSLAAIRNAGGLGVVKSVADCMDHGALVALMNAGSVLEQGSPECEPFQELQEDELVEANDSPSDAEASDFGQAVALRDSFYGYVAGIDIIEYLQFVLLTGKPVVVEVCSPCGAVGQIYARNGRVLHAHCGDVQGEQALYKCLGFRGGSFTNRPWREPARVSINQQGDLILMEAVHRKDEAQSSSGLTHGHPAHEFRSRAVTSCHGTWPD
jgi:hypothetical protein